MGKLRMTIKRVDTERNISLVMLIGLSFILAVFTNFTLQYSQLLRDLAQTIQWVRANTINFAVGTSLIFFIYLIIASIIGNINISSMICLSLFGVVAFANMKKLTVLGEPLYPVDFYQIRFIKPLLEMIGGNASLIILAILLVIMAFIILLKKIPKITIKLPARLVLLIMSGIIVYAYINYDRTFIKRFFALAGVEKIVWDQRGNYDYNGFIFGTLSNLQGVVMEKPENYSEEAIKQIAEKYKLEAEKINEIRTAATGSATQPNIIFIMSEAFWDPTRLGSLKFSEDPMKNMRETMSEQSSGMLLSPVFGGNTANTEFEALTGFSMYNLLPGSVPYQEAMDKKNMIPSIVSILEDENYDTLAIHPYKKVFYKRDRVYNTLGINKFIGDSDMKYKKTLLEDTSISDQSVVDEILFQLKQREMPTFMHVITMQNHFPAYEGKYGKETVSIEGLTEESKAELEAYTQGIKESDRALKNLFDELPKLHRPTVVVFFGDHLPSISDAIYKQGGFPNAETVEGKRLYSETPLFIYSNYNLENKQLNTISPAYLGVTLFDLLNKPITPYYAMLEELKSKLPGLKSGITIDEEGKINSQLSKEENGLLSEYELIQYDLLLGNQYSLPILFNK
jgi:phosphoglycerol transferase MdoB-like AlkP superfamily enzyme